jgi:hypothetical protein
MGDSNQSREYVEKNLREAEEHLEEALIACEDRAVRRMLVANYRGVISTVLRHYDNNENREHVEEGFDPRMEPRENE